MREKNIVKKAMKKFVQRLMNSPIKKQKFFEFLFGLLIRLFIKF